MNQDIYSFYHEPDEDPEIIRELDAFNIALKSVKMNKAFAFNGKITFETCPVCLHENVKVEHGFQAEIDGPVSDVPQKYWHCPVCGDSIVTVASLPPETSEDDLTRLLELIHKYADSFYEALRQHGKHIEFARLENAVYQKYLME